jgi:hypothetical protein
MENNDPDIESIQTALRYLKALVQNPNEEYKNIVMNVLDCIAKCFVGLGLWAYFTKLIVL